MKNIKRVKIVLENVDSIKVNADEINFLEFSNVSYCMSIRNHHKLKMKADSFVMELNNLANRDYDSVYTSSFPKDNYNIFNRLELRDITSIELYDATSKMERYYIDWSGDNPNYDKSQFCLRGKGFHDEGEVLLVGSNEEKNQGYIDHFKAWNEGKEC